MVFEGGTRKVFAGKNRKVRRLNLLFDFVKKCLRPTFLPDRIVACQLPVVATCAKGGCQWQ
jgi:hypothetical protein